MARSRRPSITEAAWLALEAQHVIALRLLTLARGGPKAAHEAERMLTEKVAASYEAGNLLAAAALRGQQDGASQVVRMLRHRVRANRRRLTTKL